MRLPLALLPVVAGMACSADGSRADGRIRVDVGGHHLELSVVGIGSPTVVLEAGVGGGIDSWARVLPALAARTRVVAYHRAGTGRSEPGPIPRTAARVADELWAALAAAAVPPPYLLVGHSLGGAFIRVFASRFPDAVEGLVLVDPTLEWPEAYPMERLLVELRRHWPQDYDRISQLLARSHPDLAVTAAQSLVHAEPYLGQLPAADQTGERQRWLEWWMRHTRRVEGMIPLMDRGARGEFLASSETLGEAQAAALPDVPVVLILAMATSPGAAGRDAPDWQRLHRWDRPQRIARARDWLAAVPHGRLVVAEDAPHDVATHAPHYVIEAVEFLLDGTR